MRLLRSALVSLSIVAASAWMALAAPSAAAAATPAGTVVMSGLDNPRGLTFAHAGLSLFGNARWALYVAEAGKGGGPGSHCIALPRGEPACPGVTGAVSRLWRGEQQRVLTGLPSYAAPDGSNATGPHDVSFAWPLFGSVTIGLGGHPDLRSQLGTGFGRVVSFVPGFGPAWSTDIAGYEATANPDGGPVDSNPYGLLEGLGRTILTDAGGNTLLEIRRGRVSTLAVLPSRAQGRPTDSVPTAVVRGPDRALYVSELTGIPFARGAANVYRLQDGTPEVFAAGFTTVLDLDFDRAGNLYVLEHSSGPVFFGGTGTLWKLEPGGARSPVVQGLTRPTSVAIGPDGAAYVSNRGNEAGSGEVRRFDVGAPSGSPFAASVEES